MSTSAGAVQMSLHANVYKYAIYYALCAETSKYGTLQRYMCDTDPTTEIRQSTFSRYSAAPSDTPDEPETSTETTLIIKKVETGTNTPLSGATFEVKAPDGTVLGSFVTDTSGKIIIPLTLSGQYVITEKAAPKWHLLGTETTKTVSVDYGNTATVTFENAPYGNLRVDKIDADSGASLAGATVEIKHIESGVTQTGTTDLGKLGGLSKKMPHTTVLFLIGAASISGVPPFNGFASKWMIYQATYMKAVESGNIGFLLVTVIALVTSVLTLASFVKVTQSVFFGQLPAEYENVKEVPFGMRLAMGLFAAVCILSGIFPNWVTENLTQPAAEAVFNVGNYINSMLGAGYAESVMGANAPAAQAISFAGVGAWNPIHWLLVLAIALLAVTLVAIMGKYDQVSEKKSASEDGKYDLFFGGEKSVYSQVGGGDLFWGFKHNWRHYFSFMHDLHSGVVNDYALWAVVALALATLFMQIAL